jgi:hypothetical protein
MFVNFDNEGNYTLDNRLGINNENWQGDGPIQGFPFFPKASDAFVRHVMQGLEDECQEFRSGRIIDGRVLRSIKSVIFVPKEGSVVVDYEKIDPIANKYLIYNKASSYPSYWNSERRLELQYRLNSGEKRFQVIPPLDIPALDRKDRSPFAKDSQGPRIVQKNGKAFRFGTLSDRGDFIADFTIPSVISHDGKFSFESSNYHTIGNPVYNVPANQREAEDVYEFRSGLLIRGTIYSSGLFKPQVGSVIISEKSSSRDAKLRVYNDPARK